ncbi:MAG: VanZ family protein [Clostridia bacterium]|nr:VanZ family protein [Clostridia bacterium]
MSKRTAWALCAGWMLLIFAMSAAPGEVSSGQSGLLIRLLAGAVRAVTGYTPDAPALAAAELLLRKGAHMAEYGVLMLLCMNAFRVSGSHRPGLHALLLCAAYAAGDELHQAFVPGRGPSPIDVLIDTAGAAAAWAAARLCARIGRCGAKSP